MKYAAKVRRFLRDDWLFAVLLAALPVLLLATAGPTTAMLQRLPELVHWQTLAALAGLMVLSRGIEDSGYLFAAGRWLLLRSHGQRSLAFVLVLFAALLAMVVTNDVALFVVVPMTLGLSAAAHLPIGRLVIFEALAVNAGSTLSPVGNPQNLYLWQHANVSFVEFGVAMAPIAAALLLVLVAAIPVAFARERIEVHERMPAPPRQRSLFWLSLLVYPIYLAGIEFGSAMLAGAAVVTIYLVAARQVLRGVDWMLLAIFLLMFVDLGLLGALPAIQALILDLEQTPTAVMSAAVLLSQAISNVPAALFLAGFTEHWKALAWGVSVGGFGLAIGSMANLIALRLARESRLWIEFHGWSLPLLAIGWALAWLLMPAHASAVG